MNKIVNKLFSKNLLNYTNLAIILLVSFSFISRFIYLDIRAIHHDESLHGYYSWLLSKGYGYIHNPLMHGPLNFHLNALSFLFFGDNDFTLRLAPALSGTFLVFTPFLFRDLIGKRSAFIISIFFLISPILIYYSRFARNDIFIALISVLLLNQIFNYVLKKNNNSKLVIISILLGLIFCIKEISFIIIFIFGSFSLIYSNFNPLIKNKNTLNKNFTDIFLILFLLSFPLSIPITSLIFDLVDINLVAPSGSIYQIGMPVGNVANYISISLSLVALSISFIFGILKFKKFWLIYFSIFWIIFIIFHSTFLTNPSGILTGYWQALGYWIAQQDVARGGQPWYYYFLVIFKFQIIAFIGFFIFIFYKKFKFSIFESFLVYWASLNLIIYFFTSEKMPWLTVNIIIPFLFIIGIFLNDFLFKIFKSKLLVIFKLNILIIPIFIFIVTIINSIETNYVDPDNPNEMIVYTQTSKFVHELSSEIIYEIENNDINVLIDSSDGYTWPWAWYMRNHNVDYFDSKNKESYKNLNLNEYEYILINTYSFNEFVSSNEKSLNYNKVSQIPFRMWFPENYRFNSFREFVDHIYKLDNISYILGHIFKKEFNQNIGNVGLTILK
ncbi:MAG: flippase activity-associated protein Agl23 [Dehalococcoidia bacterium]|tara:strand:- start:8578 stop:10413 length:1836 start_codon:yes stop_codon:yes gene_type:complete